MKIASLILILVVFIGWSGDRQKSFNTTEADSSQPRAEQPDPYTSPHPTLFPVVDEIKRIVGKNLNLDAKAIDRNAPLSKQKVAADELDVIEIVIQVEEFFNVEIKDEDIGGEDLSQLPNVTIKKLAEIVVRKKKDRELDPPAGRL